MDLRAARAFVALALGLGTAAVGGIAVARLSPAAGMLADLSVVTWSVSLAVALSTVVGTVVAIRSGAVARGRGIVPIYAGAGVLASGLSLFTLAATLGEVNPLFIVAGSIGGGVAGAPLGALLALSLLGPLRAYNRVRRNPSYAGRTNIIVGTGAWLLGAGLLASTIAIESVGSALAMVCIVIGLAAIAVAWSIQWHRVRWLGRVAARRERGWAICDYDDVAVPIGLARWTAQPEPERPGILCRVIAGASDPYRAGLQFEARLRVPVALLR